MKKLLLLFTAGIIFITAFTYVSFDPQSIINRSYVPLDASKCGKDVVVEIGQEYRGEWFQTMINVVNNKAIMVRYGKDDKAIEVAYGSVEVAEGKRITFSIQSFLPFSQAKQIEPCSYLNSLDI